MSRIIVALAIWVGLARTVAAEPWTLLHEEKAHPVELKPEGAALWIAADDLSSAVGVEVKPQGICWDEICIPVAKAEADRLVRSSGEKRQVDLAAVAATLGAALVGEPAERVYSLGPIPRKSAARFESARAPDFALPDRKGKTVRLSDFRGKKVFLFTWASW